MGVVLNNLMNRGAIEETDEKNSGDKTKFNDITTLLDKVEQEADVFQKFPTVDQIMDIKIISVDKSFRGQGVCKALINGTM